MTQLAWRRIGPKCCRFSVVWKLASGIIWGSSLKQIVYCKPFRDMENDAGRMDCVFFIPPPPYYTGSRRDFDLSLENAWYGRVSLLCRMNFRTDSGEVQDVDCAMMDVFFDYAEGRCFL